MISFITKYKHGLTVALNYPGYELTEDEIDERKSKVNGVPFCFDNDNMAALQSKNRFNGLVIPGFDHPNIKPFLRELFEERNLLRLHMNVSWSSDIDFLIQICRRTIQLITVLINNRIDLIEQEHQGCNTICFPAEDFTFNKIMLCSNKQSLNIKDFQVKI